MSFFDYDHPMVFAHRGGCAIGPENTIAAFDLGIAAGADGLELDVHLSADGQVVVHHDRTLERTTNGSGPLSRLTAAELAELDAGCRFVGRDGRSPFRAAGIGVPRLCDVLERYASTRIIVEMKVDTVEMGEAVARDVRACGASDRVCVAGFGSRSLRGLRQAAPEIPTSASQLEVRVALYRSWMRIPVRRPQYRGYQVPELAGGIRVVSPRFVRDAHAARLRVQVWTVDEESDMARMLEWGADALITNHPALAVRVRDAFLASREHLRL